jgi:hypothetical protein
LGWRRLFLRQSLERCEAMAFSDVWRFLQAEEFKKCATHSTPPTVGLKFLVFIS